MPAIVASGPTEAKFTIFLRNVAGVGVSALPSDSPSIVYTFAHALDLVNLDLSSAADGVVGQGITRWSPYELAVYNLACHLLIEFATDPSYPIATMTWATGLVTGTTAAPHNFIPGDTARIAGISPLAYSGPTPASGVVLTDIADDLHFGYRVVPNPGNAVVLPSASISGQFFANLRRVMKINTFVAGVVGSTSDVSTSVGLVVPDFMRNLTLDQMQLMKTPFGRAYLAIAQKYGPNVWGLTR